jgi:hypothetical protein
MLLDRDIYYLFVVSNFLPMQPLLIWIALGHLFFRPVMTYKISLRNREKAILNSGSDAPFF